MGFEIIEEPVKVGAVFGRNSIKPKWFVWNGKKYIIKEVTYIWKSRKGEARLLFFSVSDGAGLFEICLDQKNLTWQLNKVFVE